jgi:hypothetical protein
MKIFQTTNVCVCVCVFCRIMKDLKYHLSVKEYDIMWIDLSSKEKVKTTGPQQAPWFWIYLTSAPIY